jgi:putative glycosyltransferase (TIGR04372 family)
MELTNKNKQRMNLYNGVVMVLDSLKAFLDFCNQYEAIICYGASDHGYTVKHYLEENGIRVSFFLISESLEQKEMRDGISVYSIKDKPEIPENYGIVLSLYERHHAAVRDSLKKYVEREKGIYAIKTQEMHQLRLALLCLERKRVLSTIPSSVSGNEGEYIGRIQTIKKKYDSIEVRFIDVRRLGAYALWAYYAYKRRQECNRIFYLYYPVTQEHRPEEHLRGSNGFLLSKLQLTGIEVISYSNIEFWQYMYKKEKNIFSFSPIYTEWGWNDDLCELNGKIDLTNSLIHFSDAEEKKGKSALNKMGITMPFVCISARDNAYLQTLKREKLKNDFRDEYRNSDINTQGLAVDYLASQSIKSVRMGAIVANRMKNKKVIEYASSYRTEFLDVFLANKCRFFVGDLSGIQLLSLLSATPTVILNAVCLTIRGDAVAFFDKNRDIAILKKFWDKKNNRYLNLRDILNIEINLASSEKNIQGAVFSYYIEHEIVAISNTPEEILAVEQEMNSRIDGTMIYDETDIKLQKIYRKIVDGFDKKNSVLCNWRLGADFLRNNQWLLE